MAAWSKFEKHKAKIEHLLKNVKISIKSAWKIINYDLLDEVKMSYSAFFHYVKNHIDI
jgi:hypothetical protein